MSKLKPVETQQTGDRTLSIKQVDELGHFYEAMKGFMALLDASNDREHPEISGLAWLLGPHWDKFERTMAEIEGRGGAE